MENSIRGIQSTIKLMAVLLPPIPAVILFLLVSVRRLARERIGVSADRLIDENRGVAAMTETVKTAGFIAGAVALMAAAAMVQPEHYTPAVFSDEGQSFYPIGMRRR